VGAAPNTSYALDFVSNDGTQSSGSSITLGTVGPTTKRGNKTQIFSPGFAPGTTDSGSIVLQSSGTDGFLSGFKVDQKYVRPPVPIRTSSWPASKSTKPGARRDNRGRLDRPSRPPRFTTAS
jgi:hypothetical protein